MIDIHSHILPGVDDGARTLADSIELVRELAESGVTDIIATPHYVAETRYVHDRQEESRILSDLRTELTKEGIQVNVFLGNEIYIDKSIASLLEEGKISTMAGSNYLLVELPLDGEFSNYEDILKDLMGAGYKVILAHPERYRIVQKNYELIKEWTNWGIKIQCNLGSIMGEYGKSAKKLVKKMIKDDLVFAFGSDIHHRHGEDYWIKAQGKLAKFYSESECKSVLVDNVRKALSL